jgi:hypothetical protein
MKAVKFLKTAAAAVFVSAGVSTADTFTDIY